MMEVGSPSLQNVRARRTEMMLSPEGRAPSVHTPLGVPVGDNKGASMFPSAIGGDTSALSGSPIGDEAGPMSSSGQVTSIETLTMSPAATIDSNQITYTSPPDNGLSPPIPSAANWTTPIMPHNSLFEPSLLNVGSAEEFDKGLLRDAGNENIVIPPSAAPLDTDRMKVDVDDHRLNMATQPSYLGESQPSQADFNNIYNGGETQLVHDNQVELDDTQPPFDGETQPVNGNESFDDMVILQDNTLTASAIPLTNASQSVSREPIHGTDARSLQDSYDVPDFTPRGNISYNGMYPTNVSTGERETYATAEGPNRRVSITEATTVTVNKHPEVHPTGQLGLMEGKEEKDTNTPEPQLGHLNENVNVKGNAEEGKMSKDGVAEMGVKDDVTGQAKGVSEQDIQAIKGRKVVKKFGRKKFEGEVVDYDAENQWFKVVYEDGDEEDLELLEVKEILFTTDASSNASMAKRKRKRKGQKVLAAGAQKKFQQVKSSPGSKTKGLKRSVKSKSSPENPVQSQPKSGAKRKRSSDVSSKLESENVGGKSRENKRSGDSKTHTPRKSFAKRGSRKAMPKKNSGSPASAHENPVQSQPKSGAKRKRSSDVEAMTSSKLESENVGGKSRENKRSGDAKTPTPRKSFAKRGSRKAMPKKNSARKKGRKHRNLPNLPKVESKVENALGAGEGDKEGKPEGKRRRVDASKDQGSLVGKAVKKDFGGTLYSGVVAKFDKKKKYYKVKYEDGDQEDLELEELRAVLVQ